jgi:isopentenyl-diphosphate delta-isomerase
MDLLSALQMQGISRRKDDHLDLAARGEVGFRSKTTLLEHVELIHDALPELSRDELELGVRLLGKRLRAPLVLAGMTGGTERAREINRDLASIAEERGYAFGLGSQRAMLVDPSLARTYEVRDVAPTALVLGNVGGVQAAQMSTDELSALVAAVSADALCVHLNPAMELVQDGGDTDFRGVEATLARLASELSVPVVAKETGCGISAGVARRLRTAGVRHVDISGAGGTSWVGVEAERSRADDRPLGECFWDWGIPTAASLLLVSPLGFASVIATGGIQNGLDAARALALGADAVGMARPVLQALDRGGRAEAVRLLSEVERELSTAMLLTGSRTPAELKGKPRLLTGELARWREIAG